jgi:chromosome partitioning protein
MVVGCCNRKGGTGKTSTTGNLAHELSLTHRVAVVDADPQGSLTSWLLNGSARGGELSDVLFERKGLSDCLTQVHEGLYILPSFLSGDLRKYSETQAGSEPYAFNDLCDKLEKQGFQFVLVDLAPGLGTFEQGAIAAMDRALLVLEPEFLSVEGLGGLLDDIEAVIRKRHATVRYDWLVANRVNAGFARHKTYLGALGERWKQYRIFLVRQGSAVSESQTVHEPLSVYAPKDDRALPGYQEITHALEAEYGQR